MTQLVKLSLIFYKGKGVTADKAIRFWTKSPISHSEIEMIDGYYCSNDPKTRVMRKTKILPHNNDWEICYILLPSDIAARLHSYQLKKCGSKYDWAGIVFSQFFKFGFSSKKKWFCSKSNIDDLQTAIGWMSADNAGGRYDKLLKAYKPLMRHKPQSVSPAKLFSLAKECQEMLGISEEV